MTRLEYMEALRDKLESFNKELQQEIMEDYEQHFAEGLAAGKTEEEIIGELGNIEDMIREIPEEDYKQEIQVLEREYDGQKDHTYIGTEDYKTVVIDGLVADIIVEKSTEGRIRVDYCNEGNNVAIQQKYCFFQYDENGTFYAGVKENEGVGDRETKRTIKIMGKTFEFNWANSCSSGDIKLRVKIPAGIPVVALKTRSGDIKVRSIKSERIEVETGSGDIEVTKAEADSWDMKTTSGDIELKNLKAGTFSLQTTSGDIEMEKLEAETFSLHTASGDIVGKDVRGTKLSVGTSSGDIELLGGFEEYAFRTGSGDVELEAQKGAKRILAGTGSGDVWLDVTRVGDVEVTVSTGSGDGVIEGPNGARHQISQGSCTVGCGSCKVNVSTGSGDVQVRYR